MDTTQSEPQTDKVAEAIALLTANEKQRADECSKEVETILSKYKCRLDGAFICDSSGPRIIIQISAMKEAAPPA